MSTYGPITVRDVNDGHNCGPRTPPVVPLRANTGVFSQNYLALTLGDTFLPHSCAGLDTHVPVVIPATCSTRVTIAGFPAALNNKLLSCGSVVVPSPFFFPRVFIGS
jgi:uncharacterized Zn-binding protein involved in type VI secretion